MTREPIVADMLSKDNPPPRASLRCEIDYRALEFPMTAPVIDTHAHIVPPDMLKMLRKNSEHYGVMFSGDEKRTLVQLAGSDYVRPLPMFLTHLGERIATMDRQGVDMQILTGWVDFSAYTMPLDLGVRFSELQNDTIAAVVAANPNRYAGAANVPLQDAAAAVKVLQRAADRYGFRAAQIATYLGANRFLDDPALDPFWAAAQEMGTFLIFHPYDEQRPAGLHDFFLHNCIGYPLATTIAIVRMMYSGVFDRFPNLLIKVPHAGGFLPYQIERFQHALDFRPEPGSKGFKGRPRDVLKKLYYDTIAFSPATLRYLIDLVGAERLMVGSDYPFEMGDPDPVASVRAAVAEKDQAAVLGGTVQKIMCLNPACRCGGRALMIDTPDP
jgi:aminocarboxymuconate-semialdehyde decarboxylase